MNMYRCMCVSCLLFTYTLLHEVCGARGEIGARLVDQENAGQSRKLALPRRLAALPLGRVGAAPYQSKYLYIYVYVYIYTFPCTYRALLPSLISRVCVCVQKNTFLHPHICIQIRVWCQKWEIKPKKLSYRDSRSPCVELWYFELGRDLVMVCTCHLGY